MKRLIFAALLAAVALPATAYAHGDMSSHYLETGSLYPSFSKQPSQAVELQLMGLLDAAEQAGYPLKVGLVADEADVADQPAMLRHPQRYAEYVVAQLEGVRARVDAPVLILTPYGAGVAGGGLKRTDARALGQSIAVPSGAQGDALATAAMAAVRQVSTAGGHTLPANVAPAQVVVPEAPKVTSSGSGFDFSTLTPLLVFAAIFGSALVLFELRTRLNRRPRLITAREGSE